MPQPIEAMLARWPFLYPEITDASEQNATTPTMMPPGSGDKSSRRSWKARTSYTPSKRKGRSTASGETPWRGLNWDQRICWPRRTGRTTPSLPPSTTTGTAGGCEHQGHPGKRQAQEDRQKVNDPLPGDMAPGVVGENSPPHDQQRAVHAGILEHLATGEGRKTTSRPWQGGVFSTPWTPTGTRDSTGRARRSWRTSRNDVQQVSVIRGTRKTLRPETADTCR